ncbi:MAG: radical SAM protein [Deltaproteobacteria bacterium]|nr:radical SAM protein [Deltaproteobacteria bacterium]
MKKILLIEPPFYRLFKKTYALVKYPLSLAYLAAAIKTKTSWDVRVYNADFAPISDPFEVTYFKGKGFVHYLENLNDASADIWREVRSAIAAYGPSVVGISAKSANFASAVRIARVAKDIFAETMVVVGGPYPTTVRDRVLDCADIDMAVAGEGEQTLVELLKALERGIEPDTVPGLIFRKGNQPVSTLARMFIPDLDSLPFPHCHAREVLQDYAAYPLSAFSSIFATRGCPFNCLFCGSKNIWGRKTRFRSPDHVGQEIIQLREMGIDRVHFEDDTFGVTQQYLRAICDTIKRVCPGIQWSCELHVRLASDENISHMKEAGCAMIQLGFESGNDEILKAIRKGFTVSDALKACRTIRDHGIRLQTFFMGGFPQETEDSLIDTLKVIEALACDKVIYSIFTPYPGTEAFDLCRKMGLIPINYDLSLYNHQSPENCFCLHLSHEKFTLLSSRIEEIVVSKNRMGRGGAELSSLPVHR